MKTIALNIKSCSDSEFILEKQVNYSCAFRKLYKHFDNIDNKEFQEKLKEKYKLTEIEFRSLKSEVNSKLAQTATNKSDKEQRIIELTSTLKDLQTKDKSNNNTRKKFKTYNKIKELEHSLTCDITFGGKENLHALTKLYNNVFVIENDKEISEEKRKLLLSENQSNIDKQTKLFHQNRILHFYILGEANQIGNRFFDFDFANNTIFYKPFKGKIIEIKYSCSKKQKEEFLKIKDFIDRKELSITLQISTNQICVSFDDEVLSGYYVDEKERRKEVKLIKEKELSDVEKTEIIKAVYKKYHDDLKIKKLFGKIENRFIAVDINPDFIGYCVADRGEDGIKKIIEKGVINLSLLNEKLGLASDHPLTIKQNNKRINEVQNAWKLLFSIASHYKVACFVKEDVDGIAKNEAFNSSEANRKVRNIWHRKITEWQIEKRCKAHGIELIPIIPVYTSFIGNIMYEYFDATNAAIEICRRGMFKYKKGLFYPQITGTISDTMNVLITQQKIELKQGDVQIFKDCKEWVGFYKVAKNNGLRWRWGWSDIKKSFSTFRVSNTKSKVSIVKFID